MSTQPEREYHDVAATEQAVHDYLADHPDFFDRHPALLSGLRLPHATGDAVSLVERQVSVLRQRDLKFERQLKELMAIARENEQLAATVHELSLQLLSATSLECSVTVLEEAMRLGFNADHAVLVLFTHPDSVDPGDKRRFFRALEREDSGLGPFATFLESSAPRCGKVRDAQRQFLFRQDAAAVGSAALVPLGDRCRVGFLAIGSTDAEHYHPGMSVDFLHRVGQLVAAALSRY